VKYCLLGAGVQGFATAAVLARDSDTESIVLADRDMEQAARVADTVSSGKLVTAQVDATDIASVAAAARGCDVILDLLFYELSGNVRRAALEAGCNYVTSAAEAGYLKDIAFKHIVRDDDAFKAAGLCAVIGAGQSPGIANVFARLAADQLDEVDSIIIRMGFEKTRWMDSSEVAHPWRPHWSPEGALQDFAEQSLYFTDGKPTLVGPFANPEVYDFGGKVGEMQITSHAHEESYTLPVIIGKGIVECDVRYPVIDQAATLVAMGMGDPERVVELKDGSQVKPFDVVMALVDRPAELTATVQTRESILAGRCFDGVLETEVVGRKGGATERIRFTWYIPDSHQLRMELLERFGAVNMWVAVPMVAAAKLIHRGEVPVGVSNPEQLDPGAFLQALAEMDYPMNYSEHHEKIVSLGARPT
jgi:lysine 6-dehydrogenase